MAVSRPTLAFDGFMQPLLTLRLVVRRMIVTTTHRH